VNQRVLIVDDEPDLLELVRLHLEQAGYGTETADTGGEALLALKRQLPDLVILDLMLPDISGTELCRRLRADPDFKDLPIIMLTARADEVDRVVGLELGADDYVTKPFSPRELTLRVGAILRRRSPQSDGATALEHAALRLEPERRRCFVAGVEVELTAKEFEILQSLMSRGGRVMTRDALLEAVWGTDISVTSRTIDTDLKRLREKLGECGSLIETVRGVGYRFTD
jgi:two-component system phosphate regulon response regulator PhoB